MHEIAPGAKPAAQETDRAVRRTARSAEKLYSSRRYLCAEAVLITVNDVFGGGLTRDQAVGLAAGYSIGLGESGCLCGALAGAAAGAGLVLSRQGFSRREIRRVSGELHRKFTQVHGSTCCRILCRGVKNDRRAHFRQCAELTGSAAGLAAEEILARRPDAAQERSRPPLRGFLRSIMKRNSV
jgi:C_GCAxxG_C_C family probable redox protein